LLSASVGIGLCGNDRDIFIEICVAIYVVYDFFNKTSCPKFLNRVLCYFFLVNHYFYLSYALVNRFKFQVK